jgi:phosphohistidine phosphatase SixA
MNPLQKRTILHVLSLLVFLAAASLFLVPVKAPAGQDELVYRLKAGGHILMIRHAIAPGTGDPENFKIGDCATQRNLDDTGRAQARHIGQWLRTRGIVSARIYSSQWCRCLETARLMDLGPVQELAALNSFYERIQDRETNLRALNDFISRQPADGDLIVFVTHFVTIGALTGRHVSSGEGVLIELIGGAPYNVVGEVGF